MLLALGLLVYSVCWFFELLCLLGRFGGFV